MRRVLRNVFMTIGAMGVLATSAHAAVIDLTTAGSSGTVNGALFQQIDPQSTGTGVIEPFLRLQANGTEEGYNTGFNPPFPDVKTGTWTHELQVKDIPIVTIGGVQYYQFLLDINQNRGGNGEFLSLNEIQLYTRPTQLLNPTTNLATLGTLRYDLDALPAGDSTIELNFLLNPGSGAGDMFMNIPVAFFGGAPATDFVYLYTAFGNPNPSNDGFEEWAVLRGPSNPVPDGGLTAGMLGFAMLAVGMLRRKLAR
jgi:VPDSG-CTERM motif